MLTPHLTGNESVGQLLYILFMKSAEQAERTRNNLCNNSSAKSQFTFGREIRFKDRNRKKWQIDSFYNLPSQMSRQGGTIGRSKRDFQKEKQVEGPSPDRYNPHEIKPDSNIVFAPGRDKCTVSSIFYNTTIAYPGPGCYNPRSMSESSKGCHFAGRIDATHETISPGPKYSFESTLLDRNKVLSKLRRTGGVRIVLSNNRSRSALTEVSEKKSTLNNSMVDGYISYKGQRTLGKSGKIAIIGRQQRFRPASAKTTTPGPGKYQSFSDFIDSEKK